MSANFLSFQKSGCVMPAPFARKLLPPFFLLSSSVAYFIHFLKWQKKQKGQNSFKNHKSLTACFCKCHQMLSDVITADVIPVGEEEGYLCGSVSSPKVSANHSEMAGWRSPLRSTVLLPPSLWKPVSTSFTINKQSGSEFLLWSLQVLYIQGLCLAGNQSNIMGTYKSKRWAYPSLSCYRGQGQVKTLFG